MKNITISKTALIALTVLTSCCVSLNSFGSETVDGKDGVDFYLDLPAFERVVIGGIDRYSTDTEGYKLVLKIYDTYQVIGDDYLDITEDVVDLEQEKKSLDESRQDCMSTLAYSESDREFVYKLRESDLAKSAAAAKKQRRRFIFYGVGGGAIALAAGLLIGMFAI